MAATIYPYLSQQNIPDFEPLASSPAFATDKNLFSVTGAWNPNGGSLTGPLIATYLQQNSVKTMANFSSGSPASLAAAGAIDKSAKSMGISVVYENDATPSNSFDATSIGLRLKQLKPDAVVFPIALAGRSR